MNYLSAQRAASRALSNRLLALLLLLMLLHPIASAESTIILKPYDNLPSLFYPTHGLDDYVLEEGQYKAKDMHTYSFDSDVLFKGAEDLAAEVLEAGKNPGLGVRDLHAQGITGQGVNVAIIDQHLLLDHPEFADRIVAYYDSGCEQPENEGSMHGPSVASLLAGTSMGTAPGVKLYYAAAPSWKKDAAYYADSLHWIIQQNEALPVGEKIRLVSVSAAPQNGWFVNGELWDAAVEAAAEAGIFVMDCRSQMDTGFVFSNYYDRSAPDDVTLCKPGYPNTVHANFTGDTWKNTLFAPASFRTTAREYYLGDCRYGYDGNGGQSWAVPYVAGVMALGFQIRPDLTGDEMKALLFESAWVDPIGVHHIDPPQFIEALRNAPVQ